MASEQEGITTLVVEEEGAGLRLDLYLSARFQEPDVHPHVLSRSKLKKLIDAEAVTLNGKSVRAKDIVRFGDRILVRHLPSKPSHLVPVAFPLNILFEDEHIIVIDKPAGLSVHPGAGATTVTLVQALLHYTGKLAAAASRDPLAAARPGIVHRLDKDTTGVIVCAKTEPALTSLSRQFHDKTEIVREYAAILDGVMAKLEILHASYLYRDPVSRLRFASLSLADHARYTAEGVNGPKGPLRYAKSAFRRAEEFGGRLTLARIRLFTGRTHQIRVHAKDLGLPVVGDQVYGRQIVLPKVFPEPLRALVKGATRQMLHARLLAFKHPESGQRMRFEAPYPSDFAAILSSLAEFLSPAP